MSRTLPAAAAPPVTTNAAETAAPTAAVLAAVPTVQLAVTVTPSNAKLYVDGVQVRGNPYNGGYPMDRAHHRLTAESSGYETRRTEVVFDRDVSVSIALDRQAITYGAPVRAAPPEKLLRRPRQRSLRLPQLRRPPSPKLMGRLDPPARSTERTSTPENEDRLLDRFPRRDRSGGVERPRANATVAVAKSDASRRFCSERHRRSGLPTGCGPRLVLGGGNVPSVGPRGSPATLSERNEALWRSGLRRCRSVDSSAPTASPPIIGCSSISPNASTRCSIRSKP